MKNKVLSIDDSATIRRIISMAAAVLDFETLEAPDGKTGLDILSEQHESIALILLDWNMPGMTGIEVLRSIMDNSLFSSIPVMMVTTEGERKKIVEAIKSGAKNYLTKPFSQEDLITKIMECVGTGI